MNSSASQAKNEHRTANAHSQNTETCKHIQMTRRWSTALTKIWRLVTTATTFPSP